VRINENRRNGRPLGRFAWQPGVITSGLPSFYEALPAIALRLHGPSRKRRSNPAANVRMIASVRVVLSRSSERTASMTSVAASVKVVRWLPMIWWIPFKIGGDNRREARAPPRSGRSRTRASG
jgi:hypothetical protein